ncbi:MAG TPA: hypothetical protein VMA72_30975 [Streptosporangiaceae bacterium]|nr:hypothetical protein [Streptosporangiaceae bacterium]
MPAAPGLAALAADLHAVDWRARPQRAAARYLVAIDSPAWEPSAA